jgi:cytochrome c oxidase subunit 4
MSDHIVSRNVYFAIFGALLVGTALTVMVAFVDLDERLFGGANAVAALTIAAVKATLVVLYFMHVRYSSKLTMMVAISGVFWLGIMFLFTMSDYATRPNLNSTPAGVSIEQRK